MPSHRGYVRRSERDEQFAAYVGVSSQSLQRFAYLVTGDRSSAQDLVQAGLMQLLAHWSDVRDPASMDAYVRKIMINHHRTWWRRRSSSELVTDHPIMPGVPDMTWQVDARQDLLAQLRKLPAGQRAAVVLRYYEDMSEADAAAILGCSVGTVKSQTSRALSALRTHLGEDPMTQESRNVR